MRLWNAYDNYRGGRKDIVISLLNKTATLVLERDKSLKDNEYWKLLSINVFTNIVLNQFYNGNGVNLSEIYEIIISNKEIEKNINESNINFKDNTNVKKLDKLTEKMIESVSNILQSNIFTYLVTNSKFYYCYSNGTYMPSNKNWYSLNVLDRVIIINERTLQGSSIKVIRDKDLIDKQKEYISNNIEQIKNLASTPVTSMKSSNRHHIQIKYNEESYYLNMLVKEDDFIEKCKIIRDDSLNNIGLN